MCVNWAATHFERVGDRDSSDHSPLKKYLQTDWVLSGVGFQTTTANSIHATGRTHTQSAYERLRTRPPRAYPSRSAIDNCTMNGGVDVMRWYAVPVIPSRKRSVIKAQMNTATTATNIGSAVALANWMAYRKAFAIADMMQKTVLPNCFDTTRVAS